MDDGERSSGAAALVALERKASLVLLELPSSSPDMELESDSGVDKSESSVDVRRVIADACAGRGALAAREAASARPLPAEVALLDTSLLLRPATKLHNRKGRIA